MTLVHNLEDAEVYLRLGFTVTMSMSLVRKLSLKDSTIHANNVWNGGPVAMMEVWITGKKPKWGDEQTV